MPGRIIRRKNKKRKSGAFLIIVGMLLLLASAAFRTYSLRVLSFSTPSLGEPQSNSNSKIERVDIEGIGVSLGVTESQIIDGVWQVSNDGASHLGISANPGESGNIVVYAHNKANLFGKLPKVRKGDLVKLKNESGATHEYAVFETLTVDPSQIDYVLPKEEEVLTMYTCVGFMDSKRFIVLAKPI